jgi:hypothetical protein
LEGGPPIFGQDCTCPALLVDQGRGFPYGALTRCGPPFQTLPVPTTLTAGLFRVRSPLLTESQGRLAPPRLMSVPPATEMFQFAGFASRPYRFGAGYPKGSPPLGGLPHSEIPGSPIARISPGLFAACRVLPRLSVPRHPPDALCLRFHKPPHTAASPGFRDPQTSPMPAPMKTPGTPDATGARAPASVTQLPLHPVNQHPRPRARLVEVTGFEPVTSCLQSRRSAD